MSRALIETLLITDTTLAGYGIDGNSVFNQHDIVDRPKNNGPFIVIRWEEQTLSGLATRLARGPRILTICAHSPKEVSTDFNALDLILDRVDELFLPLNDQPGNDNYTITNVNETGRSGDLEDEGFNTVYRTAGYGVLYRRT